MKTLLFLCFRLQAQLFYRTHDKSANFFTILLVANAFSRAISQNEEIYSNPDSFNPERFFNPDGTLNDDNIEFAFGYGRRYARVFQLYFSRSLITQGLSRKTFGEKSRKPSSLHRKRNPN